MANKIILKKSSVASKVPLSSDLEIGELAVNLADQKLYSKNAAGTVIQLGGGSGSGDVVGPSSATNNAITRYDGTTGKLIENSSVLIDDNGNITQPLSITMADGTTQTVAAGKLWYNATTGSWNLGMGGGNITQQVGEELYYYGKASSAITDSPLQIVYKTGIVGASGAITFAPTTSGITNGDLILGVATESIALNGFGRVTTFGLVHGITTDGSAYSETWADGDEIWYNPVTGNPTKVKPSAPNIKVLIGTVVNAGSGGSGSFQVEINHGSVLGGTDSNVQLSSPVSGNLLIYDATAGYWKNASITAGTGIGVTNGAGSITVSNSGVTALTGTANEIDVSASTGSVTLSLPATINADTTGNAATATSAGKWTTARTLSFTGDATGSGSVDGSANVATALTLANTAVTAGSYTYASITVNGKGLITAASNGTAPVTSVGATAPVQSSGGTTPTISITQASSTTNGYLSSTDWNTFNNKTSNTGTVTSVAMTVPTGLSVSGTPITTSGTLALTMTAGYSIPTTASQTNWDSAYTQRLQWDGGSTNLVAATGRTSLGGTTVGQNFFTLTNPAAITFPRINADNSVSALDASTFRTAIGAGTGNGTVTSVTAGTGLSGGTITGSGTIALANTTVTAGSYTNTNITVDAQGRITAASNGTSASGTVTSVSGTGTVSGLTLTGTVTSSGSLTLGGNLTIAADMIYDSFTATASQTTFTPSTTYTSGKIDVYANGIKMRNGSDVTVTSGNSVVFASGLASGTLVDLVYPV